MRSLTINRNKGGVQSVFAPIDNSDPIVGKTIGNITAVAKDCDSFDNSKRSYYICECSIHNTIFRMRRDKFMAGNLGCELCANSARGESHIGLGSLGGNWSYSPILYNKWQYIRNKCHNPNFITYKSWGAIGYTMCNEWKDNFLNFAKWAESVGYVENSDIKFSIDILPNNKEYNPNTTIISYK